MAEAKKCEQENGKKLAILPYFWCMDEVGMKSLFGFTPCHE
jgi:hypothetical protein